MIKELHIQNFQSHKDTTLKFHPGVNIVVGTSDSGKSAIIRALRWAVYNKPLGDAFRSRWGGDTSVTVKTTDTQVLRFKGKGGDRYVLEGIQDPFKAFGTSVPTEVEAAVNMTEINLQAQMDSHFLLSSNPGEVARHFNKVARIEAIDSGLQEVEKWVRANNQEIAKTETNIFQYSKTMDEYEWLDAYDTRLSVVEDLYTALQSTQTHQKQLETVLNDYDNLQVQIKGIEPVIQIADVVEGISDMYDELDGLVENLGKLERLCGDLEVVKDKRQTYRHLTEIPVDLDVLLDMYETKEELEKSRTDLVSLGKQLVNTQKELVQADELYNKAHETLIKNGGICSSCPFV